MKKEYISPELELLDLKSPVIMATVIGGEGYKETTMSTEDEFDELESGN